MHSLCRLLSKYNALQVSPVHYYDTTRLFRQISFPSTAFPHLLSHFVAPSVIATPCFRKRLLFMNSRFALDCSSCLLLLTPGSPSLMPPLLLPSLLAAFASHPSCLEGQGYGVSSCSITAGSGPCLPRHPSAAQPLKFTPFILISLCSYKLLSYAVLLAPTEFLFESWVTFLSLNSPTILLGDFNIHSKGQNSHAPLSFKQLQRKRKNCSQTCPSSIGQLLEVYFMHDNVAS